jgi:hypothetical protein
MDQRPLPTKHISTITRLAIFCIVLLASHVANAQETEFAKDTVIIEREDTVLMKSYAARFDPRKALLYAAIVPGLGQVYNKKYWKLPLVYGGFLSIGLQINKYNDFYLLYREQLFYNLTHGREDETDQHPITLAQTGQLRRAVDRAQRERDFWIIMMGTLYILQIVDAHVDAHLKEFDLNPNLRVSLQPVIDSDSMLGRQTGLSLTLKF